MIIFEINPIKDISNLSFYFDDHYLGKDKARNVFIRSADKLYKTEALLDGQVIEKSWQKQIRLIRRKKAQIVYRLTEKGEVFLKAIYDKFGSFILTFIDEFKKTSKLNETIKIANVKKDMAIELGMIILIE